MRLQRHTDACFGPEFKLFSFSFTSFPVDIDPLLVVFAAHFPPFFWIEGWPISSSWKASESLIAWFVKPLKFSF